MGSKTTKNTFYVTLGSEVISNYCQVFKKLSIPTKHAIEPASNLQLKASVERERTKEANGFTIIFLKSRIMPQPLKIQTRLHSRLTKTRFFFFCAKNGTKSEKNLEFIWLQSLNSRQRSGQQSRSAPWSL